MNLAAILLDWKEINVLYTNGLCPANNNHSPNIVTKFILLKNIKEYYVCLKIKKVTKEVCFCVIWPYGNYRAPHVQQ